MGGSDQWGNIVTGTELIRRLAGGEAHALTAPLITKADGSKFGKSEGGNVWLDKAKTSPYTFYQYWLNTSDDDAARYIKIFTFLPKENIESVIASHAENPAQRVLQKRLAEEITRMVHSEDDLQTALAATDVLFGRATREQLQRLSADDLLSVFEGVPQATAMRTALDAGIGIVDALSGQTGFMASNSEARRALKENSIQVNKEKVGEDYVLGASDLLCDRYILLQRGKKNYYLLVVE
jgi:tyrosyl-tRNA synthetase